MTTTATILVPTCHARCPTRFCLWHLPKTTLLKRPHPTHKLFVFSTLLSVMLAAGCATRHIATKPHHEQGSAKHTSETTQTGGLLTEPDTLVVGRIVKVNATGKFVLISFPIGSLPRPEQSLYVYRNSQKIGELKATRHMLDELVIADIVSGQCSIGDEVADR